MNMKKLDGASLAAAAAVLGMGAMPNLMPGGPSVLNAQEAQAVSKGSPVKTAQFAKAMAAIFGGMGGGYVRHRKPGPGWSNRQVKRMATKRRNVIRNRKNHR